MNSKKKTYLLRTSYLLGIVLSLSGVITTSIDTVNAQDKTNSEEIQKQIDSLKNSDVDSITKNLKESVAKIAELQHNSIPIQAEYNRNQKQIKELKEQVTAQSKIQQAKNLSTVENQIKDDSYTKYLIAMFSDGVNNTAQQAMLDKQLSENIENLKVSLDKKEKEIDKEKSKLNDSIHQQRKLADAATQRLSSIYAEISGNDKELHSKADAISELTDKILKDQIEGKDTKNDQSELSKVQKEFMELLLKNKDNALSDEQAKAISDAQNALIDAKNRISTTSNVLTSNNTPSMPSSLPGWNTYGKVAPSDSMSYGQASYPDGQCTAYAAGRARSLGFSVGNSWGNGAQWGGSARSAGYRVDSNPEPGSLVSFASGVAGAAVIYGHVAFVEDVHSDGSFMISEANASGGASVSYRVISGATPGMSFIHF